MSLRARIQLVNNAAVEHTSSVMPLRNRARSEGCGWCPASRGSCAAVAVLAIAIPLICLSYLAFGDSSAQQPPQTLVMASVLFRHGDRTPTDFYPNDPYIDPSFWPEGVGALTKLGKQEAYNLGVFLQQRYSLLLPQLYSPDDAYVVSSDHDRCLMTAQLCLAGLYPPRGSQVWKPDLAWQPVPVHTTPRNLDQLIVMKKPCPRYDQELARVQNATVLTEEEMELFEYLTKNTGMAINDILSAEFLYNTLEIEDNRGLKLPSWTATGYPEPLRNIAARSLALFTETELLQRLKGGPLIKDVVLHMADKAMGHLKPDRKLFLYSGHDITLVSVMRSLGIQQLLKPDPAAALFVELHRAPDGSQHFVEVSYLNNSSTSTLEPMEMIGCPRPCSLSSFIKATSNVVPKDWDSECLL